MLNAFIQLLGPVQSMNAHLERRKPPPKPTDALSAMFRFTSDWTRRAYWVRGNVNHRRLRVQR